MRRVPEERTALVRTEFPWPALVNASLLSASLTACAASSFGTETSARRPLRPTDFALGLPAAENVVRARGEVALRPPLEGRVPIPGGSYTMGSSLIDLKRAASACQREPLGAHCDEDDLQRVLLAEAPAHEVTLSPFWIDRTEVTVAAYARCVSAGACAARPEGDHDARYEGPSLPATFVDWDAAVTFCAWSGGRLPTEAEWEFAARGTAERQYPWGNVYNPYLSNHGSFAADPLDATDGFLGLAPVGSFPDGATPLGILDLAGNVSEWVSDFYETDAKGFGYDAASQVDPKGPKFGTLHVVRGGDFAEGAPWVRGASRSRALGASGTVGFRCAADVR